MATYTTSQADRAVPSIFDRLRKLDPQRDGSSPHWIPPEVFLRSVERDLQLLLRSEVVWTDRDQALAAQDLDAKNGRLPFAFNSSLFYGLPALRGALAGQAYEKQLTTLVKRALRIFEPRIDPRTLKVNATGFFEGREGSSLTSFSRVEFAIDGDVMIKPVSEHLSLRAVFLPAFAEWRIEAKK